MLLVQKIEQSHNSSAEEKQIVTQLVHRIKHTKSHTTCPKNKTVTQLVHRIKVTQLFRKGKTKSHKIVMRTARRRIK